jgi:hypothetical protein
MPNKKAEDLLKLLGMKTPAAAPVEKPTPVAPRLAAKAEPATRSISRPAPKPVQSAGRGKAIQFYLHDADEKLIREFAVWLSPHRKRINDSLVLKAVLRAAKTGPELLAGYDQGIAITKANRYPKPKAVDSQ